MQVNLAGRVARVAGPPSPVKDAIVAALAANGAARGPDNPDIFVDTAPLPDAMPSVRAGGRIVVVTSALGLVPARGEGEVAVAAAAVIARVRTLAMALAGDGILVNAVAVGALEGDRLAARLRTHAQFGPATPDDVANAVLFLVDPDSSYLTGHVLTVDGGYTAGYARDF
jgi:NAD(P)-dependent dehydrogenase (short-subunit alcohol dehydrogenase family)